MKTKDVADDFEKNRQKELEERRMKLTNTAFILLFPALIVAMIAVYFAQNLMLRMIVLALSIYQFLLIKKFIEDYYRK